MFALQMVDCVSLVLLLIHLQFVIHFQIVIHHFVFEAGLKSKSVWTPHAFLIADAFYA